MIFCCALTVFTARAQFSGAGSGTSEDPYQITTADELAEMAYFLGDSHAGTCFELMNDIDLTEWIAENNPTNGWNPIGVSSASFYGNFDGGYHIISGLYINRPTTDYVGIFGYVASVNISNLYVTGSGVTGQNHTGGLVGYVAEASTFSNCHVTIDATTGVSGRENTGGIVGRFYQSTITDCLFNGKVKGSYNCTGGLVGWSENSTFTNCVGQCDIQNSNNGNVGGIIGQANYNVTMSGCKHLGIISGKNYVGGVIGNLTPNTDTPIIENCSHNGDITGSEQVGGIVGRLYFQNDGGKNYPTTIRKCQVNGRISGTNYAGGIMGKSQGYFYSNYSPHVFTFSSSIISVSDCYTTGAVIGTQYVGGIVGELADNYNGGSITSCYCRSSISGKDYVGGIVGYLYRGTVTSNFAIGDTLSISNTSSTKRYGRVCGYKESDGTIGATGSQQGNRAYGKCVIMLNGSETTVNDDELNGTGVSLTALKNINTYIGLGWNFTDTWTINNGKTLPYLQWEKRISAIALSKTTANMTLGETMTIETNITPLDADNKELVWESSDENIVTVADGVVTAIAEGTATITVTAQDGSETSATCTIKVSNTQDSDPADFDNVVYMESFAAELGDEVDVPILLKNQIAGDIKDIDFYLYLPEGITPVLDEDEFPIVTISTDRTTARKHAIYGDLESDGSIHIYTTATRTTYTFSGTGGEIATIALKVADDAPNGVHQIVIRNITMESASAENPFEVLRYNLSASIGRLTFDVTDGETLNIAQAKTYDEVNYSRTFSAAGKWQALYLPFSIPVETLTANGLEVAELNDTHMYDTNEDGEFDQTTLEFLYLKRGATQPNYPYLIKSASAGDVTLAMTDVEVKATEETEIECSTTRAVFKIRGTYAGISGAVMYANNYYAMGGGALVRMANADSGLKPQRWYLAVENKDGSPAESLAAQMRITIDGIEIEENVTAISEVNAIGQKQDEVYMLDGRRVNGTDALKSGLYVKNHKKLFVR